MIDGNVLPSHNLEAVLGESPLEFLCFADVHELRVPVQLVYAPIRRNLGEVSRSQQAGLEPGESFDKLFGDGSRNIQVEVIPKLNMMPV